MDGRLRRWVFVGLVTASLPAVGCRMFQKEPTLPTATTPVAVAPQQKSGWFGGSTPKYGPPPEQVAVREARKKKGQLFDKPDSYTAIGDVELEGAFDENRAGADRDQLIDVARQRYQTALQQDPKNKAALLGLGKLYTWAGDRERALQVYQEAMKHHPRDAGIAQALARSHVRFEDWNGASRAYEIALTLDPENRSFTKALGYCQARAGKWDDSFGSLLKVMTEPEARVFLGRTLIDLGQTDQGRQQLEVALSKDPQNEIARGILSEMVGPQPNTLQQATYEGNR